MLASYSNLDTYFFKHEFFINKPDEPPVNILAPAEAKRGRVEEVTFPSA